MIKLNVVDLFDGNVEGCKFINEDYLSNILDMGFDLVFDGMEGVEIEEFDFSGCEVMLVKSEGYRGVGCYDGLVVKDGENYYIDIVSEGVVFKI